MKHNRPGKTGLFVSELSLGTLKAAEIRLSEEELKSIGEASTMPREYPGRMFDLWSADRTKGLAEARR